MIDCAVPPAGKAKWIPISGRVTAR
jgi:hypothetical protein